MLDDEDSLAGGGSRWEKLPGDNSCKLVSSKHRFSSDGGMYGFIVLNFGQSRMDRLDTAGKQYCALNSSS